MSPFRRVLYIVDCFSFRTRIVGFKQNEFGFSIPEMIIASALVIMAMLGVSSTVYQLGKGSNKNRMVSSAFALETLIVSATQNSEYFRTHHPNGNSAQTLADVLSVGGVPAMQIVDDSGVVIADTAADKTFDSEGRSCTGYPSRVCTIKVSFSLKNLGTASAPDQRFAYYIEFAKANDVLATQAMGQRSGTTTFTNQDYLTPINYMFFERSNQVEGCTVGSGNSLVITGMDRDTGQVTCAKYPSVSLGAGQISKGLTYDQVRNELQVKGVAAKKYTCPQNYMLTGVNMKNLEPNAVLGTAPRCRFVGPTSYTNSASSVHGGSWIPCAPFYEISGPSCTSGGSSLVRAPSCSPATRPVGYSGGQVIYGSDPLTPNMNAYSISGPTVDASKKKMDCVVSYSPQYCGAVIQTTVVFNTTCQRIAGIPDEIAATLQ